MTGVDVELQHVVKSFALGGGRRLTATREVSLTVAAGSMLALVGASGSGKSTLLHLVGAMDRPDSGTIRVGDTDLGTLNSRGSAAYRRGVGFVFQRFHLLPALTVLDNVMAPLVPVRVPYDKRARAREVIAAVGLGDREGALPSALSGGSSSGWPSLAHWSAPPRCCWPTNPPATWTRQPDQRSSTCSRACSASGGRR